MISFQLSLIGRKEQVLVNQNKNLIELRKRERIEEELAQAAANNFPKTAARLLKKYKGSDFSVDLALGLVKKRIEYQLAVANDFDDFTDVVWALMKSKK
jgi:hypothetical protein